MIIFEFSASIAGELVRSLRAFLTDTDYRGLKYISKNRVDRINAIAEFLSTAPCDIICLQELFVSRDFETIRASVSKHLPFFKLFHGYVSLH